MAAIKWEKLKIWLVETDANYSNSLRSALKDRHAQVYEFADSQTVEQQLQHGDSPHLLIMNVDMEDGRCFDLATRIRNRKLGKDPFLPIFLSSWDEGDDNVDRMQTAGCSMIWPKPFSQMDGIRWIEEFCRKDTAFIATASYIGPERRQDQRKRVKSRLKPVAVPNALGWAAKGRPLTDMMIDTCWRLLVTERIRSNAWSILSVFHLALQFPGDDEAKDVAAKIKSMCDDALKRMEDPEVRTAHHAFAAARAFADSVAKVGWDNTETERQMAANLCQALSRSIINDQSEAEIAGQIQREVEAWLGLSKQSD